MLQYESNIYSFTVQRIDNMIKISNSPENIYLWKF